MKKSILITLSAMLFCCIACEKPSINEVESLVLNKSTLKLNVGQTDTLVATTVPNDAAVEWSSSNPAIAVVVNGVVTGVSNGTAVVVATAGTKLASCVVTVGQEGQQDDQTINFSQYLEGSEYYIFLMDDVAMSRIKGVVHDYRVNGEYAAPGVPADGVTATMDIWNGDVTDANFGKCKGATAFGDTGVEWMYWKSGSMAWSNMCGGIRQWGMCDFTTVTGDFNFVIIYRTPRMLAGTSVTVKLYSTSGGEHNVDRGMISQSRGVWDVAEWSMAELFADGLDWSIPIQGNLSNVVYSPALVVEGANREFEICAIFCYKK